VWLTGGVTRLTVMVENCIGGSNLCALLFFYNDFFFKFLKKKNL